VKVHQLSYQKPREELEYVIIEMDDTLFYVAKALQGKKMILTLTKTLWKSLEINVKS
jgi:hypothetical protein